MLESSWNIRKRDIVCKRSFEKTLYTGRSSLSVSSDTKQYNVCEAVMADDSKFCGNCGTEFQESIIETVSEPLRTAFRVKNAVSCRVE